MFEIILHIVNSNHFKMYDYNDDNDYNNTMVYMMNLY